MKDFKILIRFIWLLIVTVLGNWKDIAIASILTALPIMILCNKFFTKMSYQQAFALCCMCALLLKPSPPADQETIDKAAELKRQLDQK